MDSLEKAADLIARYGNVTSKPDDLLDFKPSEADLNNAESRCHLEVQSAFVLIREHHRELNEPVIALKARIAEIKTRMEKATKGPWVYRNDNRGDVVLNTAGKPVISIYSGTDDSGHSNITYDDLDFLTSAREDVPYLVAQVESLQAEIVKMLAAQAESLQAEIAKMQ